VAADPRRDIDVVRQELAGAPALLRDGLRVTWEAVQTLLSRLDVAAIPRVALTGCGDSLFAGIAARLAFERYAGLPAEAVEALDLARYSVDTLPPGALVVPISYSGQVARTVEAAANAQDFGATVVALTGRPERRLGQTARYVLHVQVPSLGFSLGTSTYIGLMLGAYLLALGLGRRRDVLSQDRLQALLVRLHGVADAMEGALGAGERILQQEAGWLAEGGSILFLGAGPQYASALFGAAKLYEGAQLNGVAQNIEEWAHAQYFISGPASRIVLLAPRGRSLDRAYEVAREMRYIGAPFLVITDDDPARWQALTSRVLVLPSGTPEVFSPLLFAVPVSQVGYYLAKARGKQSYNFPSPEREREHYETLHESPFYDFSSGEQDG
jgi:glucosamine--fructose-6-phosphate aminotransferase (isomerizing)